MSHPVSQVLIFTDQAVAISKSTFSTSIDFVCPVGLAKAWVGGILLEAVIFLLTLYKTLTTKIRGLSVMHLIVRDGKGLLFVLSATNNLLHHQEPFILGE